MSAEKPCSICKSDTATRPYGPGGSQICFACAMQQEYFAEARQRVDAAFARISNTASHILLGEEGPTDLTPKGNA